jgi:hypothetical protein
LRLPGHALAQRQLPLRQLRSAPQTRPRLRQHAAGGDLGQVLQLRTAQGRRHLRAEGAAMLIYSEHALGRMDERSITTPMVEAVLRRGVARTDLAGGALRTTLCGVTVVVDMTSGRIVTVLAERNPPARPSPKRRARRRGQMLRRYLRQRHREDWLPDFPISNH